MRNRLTCIIIAFIMLCCGMCFDKFQTDSYFSTVSNSFVETIHDNKLEQSIDMIAQRETLSRVHKNEIIERTENRIRLKNHIELVQLCIIILFLNSFQGGFVPCFTVPNLSDAVILNYIHRQDGKK